MTGPAELDPLHELWLRVRRVLGPFGIPVGPEVLALWRDAARHGHGPIRAAERGDTRAVDELIALLCLLSGIETVEDGQRDAHAGEG